MNLQDIIEKVKADPAMFQKLTAAVKDGKMEEVLKEHGIDADPETIQATIKHLTENSGDMLEALKKVGGEDIKKVTENENFKEILEKGETLLGNILGGKKE